MPRWARSENLKSRPMWWLASMLALVAVVVAVLMSSDRTGEAGPEFARPRGGPASERTADTPGTPAKAALHIAPTKQRLPGAKVHGKIMWDYGGSVLDAEVALLDQAGEVIAEMKTTTDGVFELADADLVGAELLVTAPGGDQHRRDLAPLKPGEDRAFDVILGDLREIVGWVLDTNGDPQPGVFVTATWESADSRWNAVTDAGGAFTLSDVPASALRVTADGGDLGVVSVRVARTNATRREVTLVLEPTGTIKVRASAEVQKLGKVGIRCYSNAAHGEDGMWNDDLRTFEPPPEVGMSEEATPSEEPSMVELETTIGNALRAWDANDPHGSLTRMALDMAAMSPEMEREIRRDAEALHPELVGAPIEDIAHAAIEKIAKEEPRIFDTMGLAALKLQEGSSPMEAMMLADEELRRPPIELGEGEGDTFEAPVEAVEAMPEEAMPEEAVAIEAGEGVEYDLGADYVDEGYEQVNPRIEELRTLTGIDNIGLAEMTRSLVTTGRFFEPIPVRGAFEYTVSLLTDDGFELICGTVFVAAGEEVEVDCGGAATPAILEGRVIDSQHRPVEGAVVEVYVDETYTTTTDRHGRYELSVKTRTAQLLTVAARDAQGEAWHAERRQQNARPGHRTEVPDMIARRGDEIPTRSLETPFGGVGANINLGSEGVVLEHLFEDGPLAMAGAESGDVIVRIGDELGASLSVDDALAMLRGEAGTDVDLTLRSAAGELYELLVTRGTITPPSYETPDDSIE